MLACPKNEGPNSKNIKRWIGNSRLFIRQFKNTGMILKISSMGDTNFFIVVFV